MLRSLLAMLFAILWCLISLPIYGVTALLRKRDPKGIDQWSLALVQGALKIVSLICGVTLHVSGQEKVPKDTPVLYIGNHSSIFDIVLVLPLFSKVTGFVSKVELTRVPILSLWMKRLHCMPLDRESPKEGLKVILRAIDEIKSGYSVFIFPEGIRTLTGKLNPFHQGSFKVATRTGCPIVPVAFTHTQDIIWNHKPFVHPTHVYLAFGDPIDPGKLSPEEKKHIGPYMEGVVQGMLDGMK